MAVEIKSGLSADVLAIDSGSNAARVTLYDAGGNALQKANRFAGVGAVQIRQSATTASGSVVWAIHNPSIFYAYVQKVNLFCFFDGTAAATLMKYEIFKGTSVTSFSGGNLVNITSKGSPNQDVNVRATDTGLTTTGLTNITALGYIVMGRVTQTTTSYQQATMLYDMTGFSNQPLKLALNEMFGIRLAVTAVVGDNLVGAVDFMESPQQ